MTPRTATAPSVHSRRSLAMSSPSRSAAPPPCSAIRCAQQPPRTQPFARSHIVAPCAQFIRMMGSNWSVGTPWLPSYEIASNDDGCGVPGGGALLALRFLCPSDPSKFRIPQTHTALLGCFANNSCAGVPLVRHRSLGCAPPPPAPPLSPLPALPARCPQYFMNNQTCMNSDGSPASSAEACICPLVLSPGYSYSIQTDCGGGGPQGDTFLALYDDDNPLHAVAVNDDDRGACPGNSYASRINYTVPCTSLGRFSMYEKCFSSRTCNASLVTGWQPGVAQPSINCAALPSSTSTSDDIPDSADPGGGRRRRALL